MKVLLIDTDEKRLDGLSASLADEGIACNGYHSPVAATFAFAFEATPFDAVLARCRMSGMNGYDILRVFRNIDPGVPIILILDESCSVDDAVSRGAFAVIDGSSQVCDVVELLDRAKDVQFGQLQGLHTATA